MSNEIEVNNCIIFDADSPFRCYKMDSLNFELVIDHIQPISRQAKDFDQTARMTNIFFLMARRT